MDKEQFDYTSLRAKALEQLRSGQSLTGQGGVFAPLLKEFIESALEAEMDSFLNAEERSKGNKRNGKGKKTIRTSSGAVEIHPPTDRRSDFEPELIKKRETLLADNFESQILSLYSHGMSTRSISEQLKTLYSVDISADTISAVTDRVIPKVRAWQQRTLERIYPILWLDAMYYKVRLEGKVVTRAVYNILALDCEGKKELLGMYISESEGAHHWLTVLTDLKNRGVEDILIACTDNLKGFSEAILSIFPRAEVQKCIIHQIRNSLKYVGSKDQKEFMKDLKPVYQAVNKDQAEDRLLELEQKWGRKYPVVINSWQNNWDELSAYFKYDEPIRKIIYTTNAVEGFHRQVRKVTKTKGAFPSDMALMKLIYLTVENIAKKWTHPVPNWGLAAQQLAIHFSGRFTLSI